MNTTSLPGNCDWSMLPSAPEPWVQQRTWFDITGNQNREVDNSQWYRYYLDPSEDHQLGTLFVEVLLKLTGNPFTLKEFTVQTEIVTKNGKRIDILLEGIGTDRGKTIIIENKIYHTLENNLEEYWNHRPEGEGKLAVLLTLKKEPAANCGNFKNILHRVWIDEVVEQLKNTPLSPGQQHYLDAFKGNIHNLSRHTYMNEQVTFFVKNTDLVNRAAACREAAIKYIIHQLETSMRELKMESGRKDQRLVDFILKEVETEVFICIIFDQLLTANQELRIVLSLTSKNLGCVAYLDQQFSEEAKQRGFLVNHNKGNGWHNYLTRTFKVGEADWKDLDVFVTRAIRDGFCDMAIAIGNHLKQKSA